MSDELDDTLSKAAGNIAIEQVIEMGKQLAAFYLSLTEDGISEDAALTLTIQFLMAMTYSDGEE